MKEKCRGTNSSKYKMINYLILNCNFELLIFPPKADPPMAGNFEFFCYNLHVGLRWEAYEIYTKASTTTSKWTFLALKKMKNHPPQPGRSFSKHHKHFCVVGSPAYELLVVCRGGA
jgi:hypothetical protein